MKRKKDETINLKYLKKMFNFIGFVILTVNIVGVYYIYKNFPI